MSNGSKTSSPNYEYTPMEPLDDGQNEIQGIRRHGKNGKIICELFTKCLILISFTILGAAFYSIFAIHQCCHHQTNQITMNNETPQHEYALLEQMASSAGTDKGARIHNYTGVYYRYFGQIRHKALKFLEIGLFKGSSVKMWEHYFPNAELHFVDITGEYLEYRSSRSKYHFLDQSNMTQLNKFTAENGGPFDIIIDDGGHMPNQIITSFQALFPFLSANGGIYVVEDLHSAYWYGFGGTGVLASSGKNNSNDVPLLNVTASAHETPGSAIHFLKNLLDEVNFVGANTAYGSASFVTPELRQNMSEYAQHIESMHFYNSLCFIMKK